MNLAADYIEIQRIILSNATYIPLFFGSRGSGLWSVRLKLIPYHPLGLQYLPVEQIELD